jgi:hypothetical protein
VWKYPYIYAIHGGHFKVHQDDLVGAAAFLVGACFDQLHSLFSVSGLITEKVKLAQEDLLEDVPVHVYVIDYQDLRAFANRLDIWKTLLIKREPLVVVHLQRDVA